MYESLKNRIAALEEEEVLEEEEERRYGAFVPLCGVLPVCVDSFTGLNSGGSTEIGQGP